MENKILGYEKQWLEDKKAIFTATEISGQPELWKSTFETVKSKRNEIVQFMDKVLSFKDLDIVLVGAGTSAFIGEVLEGSTKRATGRTTRAVHTTDLVSFPEDMLYADRPTLMVSYARSGNSPESVGSVDVANQICENVYHLVITCNADGKLAHQCTGDNCLTILLPEEANDKSLAMTGSFTSMIIASYLIMNISNIDILQNQVERLSESTRSMIDSYTPVIKSIASKDFKRAVFLGSGSLLGIARESHLKVQELTDGKVICKFDSFLGFRHGPKAVIDNETLIIFHLTADAHANLYEDDLINDINDRKDGLLRVAIGTQSEVESSTDHLISTNGTEDLNEIFYAVAQIVPMQILGFMKSLDCGLSPDQPSVSGNISRVVKGVTIYPYEGNVEKV